MPKAPKPQPVKVPEPAPPPPPPEETAETPVVNEGPGRSRGKNNDVVVGRKGSKDLRIDLAIPSPSGNGINIPT
jgi:outer membrane biosynthesis protein TonB